MISANDQKEVIAKNIFAPFLSLFCQKKKTPKKKKKKEKSDWS